MRYMKDGIPNGLQLNQSMLVIAVDTAAGSVGSKFVAIVGRLDVGGELRLVGVRPSSLGRKSTNRYPIG
jgi:hypothetical protein